MLNPPARQAANRWVSLYNILQMKKLIKKIWKDSVGSNLIASALLAIFSLIFSLIKSFTDQIDFKSAFIDFWTIKIELWLIISLIILIVVATKIFKKNKQFKYVDGELELDKQLFIKIRDVLLPQDRTIGFLRHNNFAGFSFDTEMLNDIYEFENEKENPNFHFFHPELEQIKNEIMESVDKFTYVVAVDTLPTLQGRQTVPEDWEIEQPERFDRVVGELHNLSHKICDKYDILIRTGRSILKV